MRETPTTSGRSCARIRSNCASNSKLCSSVFPKPIPGSNAIAIGLIFKPMAHAYCCRKKFAISSTTSSYRGCICIVRGVPCICMMMNADFVSATSGSICLSPRPPVTSFTSEAPASIAARATSAFDVSIEIGTSTCARSFSITGITRRNSSSSATGSAPGRVDSPPTSMMFALSAAMVTPRSIAFSAVKN